MARTLTNSPISLTKPVLKLFKPLLLLESKVLDPMSLLYLSSDEGDSICVVQVKDEGSQPHYAEVLVQGVLSQDVIDSGADITIMGTSLFQKVATANRIKNRDFHKPDKCHSPLTRKHLSSRGTSI